MIFYELEQYLLFSVQWKIFHSQCMIQIYNLKQKIGDKFTRLSKTGFSMECFTVDFFHFFAKKRQNFAFRWTAGYSPSSPSKSGIFLKFPNFLRSSVIWQLMRQLVHSLSGDNNWVPFHLWWKQILLKSGKVSKCFVQDCKS